MAENALMRETLPDLLSTQLLTADVYAAFYKAAVDDEEQALWSRLLREEFAHIRFVSMMMEDAGVPRLVLPEVKIGAFREIHDRALTFAKDSAFERVLWALRLEHAEIDFGVEALAMDSIGRTPDTPVYPAPVREHYEGLLEYAARYRGAREIAAQMARIEEHLPGKEE
jgi:hypothetical protein